ncbi:MAG: S8 family serine peptidase [Hyphomicrobiales bacterium]|nr:S8 family serine peptidase [Hyphomicrobiales bacterium]
MLDERDLLNRFAHIEDVRWIEEITEDIDDNVNAATTNQSGTAGTAPVWNQGLNGQGQIIGVMDSSPADTAHCHFQDPVDNTPSFSHRKVVSLRNANGDAAGGHATFVAGCAAGDDFNNPGAAARRGAAWAARLAMANRRDLTVFGGTASLLSELNAAAAAGAVIHSNSWHENNVDGSNQAIYSQASVDTDTFTWNNEDHLVLGSAGNTGEEQGAPGTAKNAICVSAAQADPNEMNIGDGNPGPTADGRNKPDLVGVGCSIQSATVGTACGTGTRAACATSYATPHIAGAAGLVRQYYTEGWYPTGAPEPSHAFTPSGALLKATLLNSTRNMTGVTDGFPGVTQGWGLVRLDDTLPFPGDPIDTRVWDTRNVDGLATGETAEHHVDVAANTQRLKVTLVWAEPPSAANSTTPLVNNLDLEVVSPDGTQTFLGNDFAAGVSTTGGTADTTENVEMVLINNPAPGDWTIRVVGTAVNVGAPGQGYALVASADLTDPPATTGDQDTLVVRVQFADVAFVPPLPNLQNLMNDVAAYIDEVSYGQASVDPLYRGSIQLDHPKSYYYHPERSLLVELVEEVVAKLIAAEPTVFEGPTGDPADDIDRMIIVTNDVNFTEDWATTGPWPYNMPAGFTRPISVSVQSYANSASRFTHGLLHQFGLVDLYAHPGVVFPRPYVDEWDNMAGLFQNVHPLVWSKQRAGWVTAHGSTIDYIPRPAAGTSYSGLNPIPLFLQESTATNRKAIAIGLTEGAAAIDQENAFYFIEARSNSLGGFDDNLPDSGVLVYYVNELIAQGEGPVIIRDDDVTTVTLADAPLDVGDSLSIPGPGITIAVQAGTGGAAYDIDLTYTPPVTDYNVRITRGDTIGGQFYSYFSPDIWVDSPRGGFDQAAGPKPHEDRDQPVIGELNHLYARITNDGPATAFDFDVRFRISDPYHTVGGEADFDTFIGIAHVDSLAAGASTNVKVNWTPQNTGESHACLLVDIINLVGTDTNPNDHEAQENLNKVTSVTSSPFKPVTSHYTLTNPYDEPALFYFRADGAPRDWKTVLSPAKILLKPGERITGTATITPPLNGELCSTEFLQITSWTPRGDTMIPLGGAMVQVDLRRPTTLTLDAVAVECRDEDLEQLLKELHERREDRPRAKAMLRRLILNRFPDAREPDITTAFEVLEMSDHALTAPDLLKHWDKLFGRHREREPERERPDVDPEQLLRACTRIAAKGCTDPALPDQEIIVRFTGPDGDVEYQTVLTDEHGCFEAFMVTIDEGIWQVDAEYPGGRCDAPATSRPRRVVKGCDCDKERER